VRSRAASHTETETPVAQAVSEDGGAMAPEYKVAGRKSSKAVVAGAIGALSLVVAAGCSSPDTVTARCVDKDRLNDGSYRVVDEDRCDDSSSSSSSSHYGSGGGGYFFYYGGSATGSRVSGGSTSRPSDAKIVTEKGNVIQRGGMGGRGGSGGSGGAALIRRSGNPLRPGRPHIVERQGLGFHVSVHPEHLTRPYWDESVHYEFTMAEVLALEETVEELHRMCLAAVEHVVAEERYADFGIPEWAAPFIRGSWKR